MAAQSNGLYAECILPLDEKAIRVLYLELGDESDEIRAHLQLLSLDTDLPPQYECVSYVWGDPSFTKRAIINEQYIQITKNLYDALYHIRSKIKTMVIWADAICSDSDVDEKSRQVAMMAEIYRQCSKVHIWLGLPEPGSLIGDPFEFLDHFVRGKHFYDFPACDNILNDFLQVVKSPWWTRAWTVQECLLPKETVVMFRTWTVTWDYILRAGHMKNSHGDGPTKCCVEANTVFNPHQLDTINGWL
ncbi:uncharacterized protein K441DRAFT_726122 [Cenococcum geophilum 1.58]|uniref:uncharacterized protein n=1 Tax=Cenococcum geophilum 1.58 TaxID=794803 RepID=UPI00358F7158|nr:hypothetical protein K441DRAFT_726122 [Cenococcum geophilum 1.58]